MPGRLDALTLKDCQPRRICILKPSALGDVVQSLPVLPAIRARWPRAWVTWVIRDDLSELVDGHPLIDQWLPYHRRGGALAFLHLLRQLRSRRFDLVIDLQGLLRTGVMALSTAAPLRVGLETSREGAALTHNIILPDTGRDVPAHQRSQRLIDFLATDGAAAPGPYGGPLLPPALTGLSDRDADGSSLESLHAGPTAGPPLLAVHPGSRWPSKCWPVGRFAAVALRAVRAWNARVVVLGSASESARCRSLVASLRAAIPACDVEDLSGATTITGLAAKLRAADLLLSSDSGPLHLAAALGTPVVGVYTSTSPVLSGPSPCGAPEGPWHQLVAAPTTCAPCYRRRCSRPDQQKNACQRDLSVESVWQALQVCRDRNRRAEPVASPGASRGPAGHAHQFTPPAAAAPAARRPA